MHIHKAIVDNMSKINTTDFMPERDTVSPLHTCVHTHTPKCLIITKNFVGPKQKLSLKKKSQGGEALAVLESFVESTPIHNREQRRKRGGVG